jgi:hypothetical protein
LSSFYINSNIYKRWRNFYIYTKIYTFIPKKTVIIPEYTVSIEGKEYKTKKLKVKVVKPQKAGKNAPIQLQLKVDKTSYYDGEGIKLNLIFKQLPNVKFDDIYYIY